jgi:elongation factor 3
MALPPSPLVCPQEYGGGVVIVSHHGEFVNQVCQEKWHVGGGQLEVTGQSAAALEAQKLEWKRQEETTDAFGNTIKIKVRAGCEKNDNG